MKKTLYFISALLSFTLFSCEDEVYDFPGDSVNKVYLESLVNTVNGANASLSVLSTPVSLDKETVSFPVACTLPASSELKVTLSVDPSWVESYNAAKGTSYAAMPAEAVELSNSTLTIPANSTNSSDEASVTITDEAVRNLEIGTYLIALEINAVSGGDAEISSNRNVVYTTVVVNKDEDNIYDVVPDASLKGNLLGGDRTNWACEWLNASFNGEPSLIFDGLTYNNVQFVYSELDGTSGFVVDMQQEYSNISGIRYDYYSSWGRVYAVTSADIYTSLDNQEWTYQGRLNNSLALGEAIFYAPVSARYIKTMVCEVSSTNVYICDFNIYVKE